MVVSSKETKNFIAILQVLSEAVMTFLEIW